MGQPVASGDRSTPNSAIIIHQISTAEFTANPRAAINEVVRVGMVALSFFPRGILGAILGGSIGYVYGRSLAHFYKPEPKVIAGLVLVPS